MDVLEIQDRAALSQVPQPHASVDAAREEGGRLEGDDAVGRRFLLRELMGGRIDLLAVVEAEHPDVLVAASAHKVVNPQRAQACDHALMASVYLKN